MRFLYHGTVIENKDNILINGLKPYVNWDSATEETETAVVSLTDSAERALIEAYVVDVTKIECGEKERPAAGYVALRIDASHYSVRRWQVDEWWINDIVTPNHISIIMEESFESVERRYKKKCPI